VAIKPIRNPRTGSMSYRVTGTIRGKQRKQHFTDLAEAEETQAEWELERTLAASAARPKLTRLTREELAQAEAANELLRGTGMTVMDAVRHLLRSPPVKRVEVTFKAAYEQFLEAKKEHISARQHRNYESAARRFSSHIGAKILISDITTDQIVSWLKSLDCGKKSWNTYRDDLGAIFSWFVSPPRCWLADGGPVSAVERFRKRHTSPGLPKRLPVPQCRELMAYLEAEQPHWVTFFATTLFAGLRPDGEMTKLAEAIRRDGLHVYLRGATIYISAEIAKDGRERFVPLPENLSRWYAAYPPSADSMHPGHSDEYAAIRRRFKIPHDGLRHSSATACAVLHGVVTSTKTL
jgi:hypothetical protein